MSEDCIRVEAETEDIKASELEAECARFEYVLKKKTYMTVDYGVFSVFDSFSGFDVHTL